MDPEFSFNLIDAGAAILVALGMIVGYRRGLSGEIARTVGVVVAFVAGMTAYEPVTAWLMGHAIAQERTIAAMAFLTVFLAAFVAMILIRMTLGRLMKVVFHEGFDRVGGLVAGGVKAVLTVLTVLIVVNLAPNEYLNRKFGDDSMAGRLACRFVPLVRQQLQERAEEE